MPRKSRLENTFEPADALIGIVSDLPAIRLVHFVNQVTGMRFACEDDLGVYFEKLDQVVPFGFYHFRHDDFRSDCCLIPGNSGGLKLIPKAREFDFFLIVRGAMPDAYIKSLMAAIKKIAGVRIASLIRQEALPELGPVLSDLELHLMDVARRKPDARSAIMPPAEEQ